VLGKVALKILHPRQQHDRAHERLIAEARAGAKLDHRNVVGASAPAIRVPKPTTKIDARWSANGATCVSHSRLWMKYTVITRASGGDSLTRSEDAFRSEFGLDACDVPDRRWRRRALSVIEPDAGAGADARAGQVRT
jgi:hypothetical protein